MNRRRHARKFHAHQIELDPYRFRSGEFVLVGIAAVIAAPLVWAFSVLALTFFA